MVIRLAYDGSGQSVVVFQLHETSSSKHVPASTKVEYDNIQANGNDLLVNEHKQPCHGNNIRSHMLEISSGFQIKNTIPYHYIRRRKK